MKKISKIDVKKLLLSCVTVALICAMCIQVCGCGRKKEVVEDTSSVQANDFLVGHTWLGQTTTTSGWEGSKSNVELLESGKAASTSGNMVGYQAIFENDGTLTIKVIYPSKGITSLVTLLDHSAFTCQKFDDEDMDIVWLGQSYKVNGHSGELSISNNDSGKRLDNTNTYTTAKCWYGELGGKRWIKLSNMPEIDVSSLLASLTPGASSGATPAASSTTKTGTTLKANGVYNDRENFGDIDWTSKIGRASCRERV